MAYPYDQMRNARDAGRRAAKEIERGIFPDQWIDAFLDEIFNHDKSYASYGMTKFWPNFLLLLVGEIVKRLANR